MANLRVEIEDREFADRLREVIGEISDKRALWPLMADAYLAAEAEVWQTWNWNRWPELSPTYEYSAYKLSHRPGRLLEATGHMKAELIAAAQRSSYGYTVFTAWTPLANIHQNRTHVKNAAGTFPLKRRGKRKLYAVSSKSFQQPFYLKLAEWGREAIERKWEG